MRRGCRGWANILKEVVGGAAGGRKRQEGHGEVAGGADQGKSKRGGPKDD